MLDAQAFTGGVKPGGLTVDHEVRILLCYLLHNIERPLTFMEINDILQIENVANYFEYSQALARLLESGHVTTAKTDTGEEQFEIAALGTKTSEAFEKSLPISVRDGVIKSAKQYLLQKKLERENKVQITKQGGGYSVSLTITDIDSDLLSLSLFVPTQADCEKVKQNFLADPAVLYRGVVAMLTGDEFTVRSVLSARQEDDAEHKTQDR